MIDDSFLNNFINSKIFGICIHQEGGKIVFVNDKFSQIVGYDTKDLVKMNFSDFFAEDREYMNEFSKKSLSNNYFYEEIEYRYYKCKNGLVPVQTSTYQILYKEKLSYLVIVLDRTREKSIEKLFYTLKQINQLIIREENEDVLLKTICEILVNDVGFTLASIGFIDEESKRFKPKFIESKSKDQKLAFENLNMGIDPDAPYGKGSIAKAYYTKKVVVLSDVMNSKTLSYWHEYYKEFNTYSICSVPILKDNKVKYLFMIYDSMKLSSSKEVVELLEEVKNDISFALERIEYQNNLILLQKASEKTHECFLVMDESGHIQFANEALLKITGFSKDELIGNDIRVFQSKYDGTDFFDNMFKILKKGSIFHSNLVGKRKDESLFYLDIIIFSVTMSDKKQKYVLLGKDISGNYFDNLTGFLNRISFYSEVDSFIKKSLPEKPILAVIKINPLNFTIINQAFGFDNGNMILIQIAQRLRSFFGPDAIIAKFESDKFAVFVKNKKSEEDILNLSYELLDVLIKSYFVDNNQLISVSFNIGITIYPKDGDSADQLVNKALTALLDARQKGENCIGFFRNDLSLRAKEMLIFRSGLEDAISKKEFVLYCQPYVDKNFNIVGAEGLLRWKKKNEVILPMKFIPYLENTNMIVYVEEYILDIALQIISRLVLKGVKVPLSVNFSYKTLKRENIIDILYMKIGKFNIDPNLLRIEIIERIFLEDLEYTKDLIEKLLNIDIHFMLDDFGTGFSSLSYISKLNISYIKIDISFVRNILDECTKKVVEAIIFLAKKLNIKTIAEGVETIEQFEILRNIGCDYFQGFLFSKPLPQADFEDFIITNNKILPIDKTNF
ncbi:PAS domain S-box-containing protein/diguanylate cyclase (GGDEF) domain-containing protein [Thermodesulfobium acidiphilum]|uniref:PAS domain S-box-containing protein/diguanylate cyclase (GGDEF) domain-containing protein n=1 Tax=Thermodesulfobium acidiphilum TaxID=1794699 RepID=A0A2R4W139_THEAF|nr:EAL domain-containing protein [Thermodesulfobium acidiphilum]AWB10398.1 PAS domain S-box-containing protein/diguanylate cyclase (GGDEF) domain-containing protein [Thermodesulfobium acidiphilum]